MLIRDGDNGLYADDRPHGSTATWCGSGGSVGWSWRRPDSGTGARPCFWSRVCREAA